MLDKAPQAARQPTTVTRSLRHLTGVLWRVPRPPSALPVGFRPWEHRGSPNGLVRGPLTIPGSRFDCMPVATLTIELQHEDATRKSIPQLDRIAG